MALTDTLISEYRQLLMELTESRRPSSRENRAARDIATRWHKRLQGDRIAAAQGHIGDNWSARKPTPRTKQAKRRARRRKNAQRKSSI